MKRKLQIIQTIVYMLSMLSSLAIVASALYFALQMDKIGKRVALCAIAAFFTLMYFVDLIKYVDIKRSRDNNGSNND